MQERNTAPGEWGSSASESGGDRVEILDVLRGVAILGMLVANLEYFRTPEVWGGYEESALSDAARLYLFVEDFLAQGKFITALSFLLGLGLALQVRRAREAGRDDTAFLLRRLLVLAALGATHALFIWSGDILLLYAALGFPFLLLVERRPKTLVALACGILGTLTLAGFSLAFFSIGEPASSPPEGLASAAEAAYTSGSFAEMTAQRGREYLANLPAVVVSSGPQVFAMMLLGAAAANAGWVGGGASLGGTSLGVRARRTAFFGLAVGVPLNLFYALPGGAGEAWYYLKFTAWLVGAPVMALGWMGLVAALHARFGFASERLAAVGRMALTNYLAQSLVMTTVFYWFGLYGSASIEFAVILMVGVWLLQILWSRAWLSRFRHGPVEWLWRRLSYGRSYSKGPR